MRLLPSCVLLLAAPVASMAADLFTAGFGTWDAVSLTGWSAVSGGPYADPWVDGERAVFEGEGGMKFISGSVASAGLGFLSGSHTVVGGTLLLSAPFVDAGAFTNVVSAVIDGSEGLTKQGTGRIELTGAAANTYTGQTTVSAGLLFVNKTGGVVALPGDVLINGGTLQYGSTNAVADTASIIVTSGLLNTVNRADTIANLTVNSTGQNTFSGLAVTNLLRVTAGNLQDAVNSNGTLTTRRAELSGGSTSRLGANTGPSTWNIGPGGLDMAGATIQFGNGGGVHAARVVLGGDVHTSGTNNFTRVNLSGPRQLDLGGVERLFVVASGPTTVGVEVTNGSLRKTGAGTLALNAANTFAGTVTIEGGMITVARTTSLGDAATGTVVHGGNGTVGQGLNLSGGITVNEPLNFVTTAAGRGTLTNTSGSNTWAGPITVNTTTHLVQVSNSVAGATLTLSGDIAGTTGAGAAYFVRGSQNGVVTGGVNLAGPGGLAKTDDGTWTIGVAGKTYAWNATNVARGVLKMGAAGVHPAVAVLNIGQSDTMFARFDLNGFDQTVAGLTLVTAGGVKEVSNNGATPATLTLRVPGAHTYGGSLSNGTGGLSLVKQGAGRQTLTNPALTLGGSVRVEDGVLALASASDNPFTASASLTVSAGGTLEVTGLNSGRILLPSGRVLAGDGTVTGGVSAGSGSRIAPGPGIATLATGSLSLLSGSRLEAQLNAASNQVDRVNVTGDLFIDGGAILDLSDVQPGSPAAGAKFALLAYTGAWNNGVFNDPLGAAIPDDSAVSVGGLSFVVNYNDTTDGVNAGQFVTLTSLGSATPYEEWAAGHSLAPLDGQLDDADSDGELNLVEFGLNGHPANALAPARRAAGVSETGPDGFLYLTVPVRAGASFSGSPSLLSQQIDGIRYRVEGSADQADWSVPVMEIGPVFTNGLPAAETGWSYRTFRFTEPLSNPRPRGYLRIGVDPGP